MTVHIRVCKCGMEERGLVNVDMLTRDINALLVYNMLTYILYMYM